MTSEGDNRANVETPQFSWGNTLAAITDEFLPELGRLGIEFGEAAILARNWTALVPVSQRLRDFGVPIVGPGARPYRRGRLFATLAEQLCGAVLDGYKYRIRYLERAIFGAIQDITGASRPDVFSYNGRTTAVHLVRRAETHAAHGGAEYWLDLMSEEVGKILHQQGWIDQEHIGLFKSSVVDMKSDMHERDVDIANMSIEDLGIFASPNKALRLMTIHNAKGHEYKAVAIIGLRDGVLPDWRAQGNDAIEAERRLFYVGVTRAQILLFYIGEPNQWGNPPCRFLGPQGVRMLG
jgi:DNA helicase II / ATP-dependent DNA helicase PcrA